MSKKIFLATSVALFSSVINVDANSLGDGQITQFEVKASVLNMRSGAGTNYPVVTKLKKGKKLFCKNEDASYMKNGFVKVTDGHFEGWVSRDYIKLIPTIHEDELSSYPTYFLGVTSANLNLRYGKSLNSSIKFTMPKGTQVEILNDSGNGWLYVKTKNPKTNRVEFGYCSDKYIK